VILTLYNTLPLRNKKHHLLVNYKQDLCTPAVQRRLLCNIYQNLQPWQTNPNHSEPIDTGNSNEQRQQPLIQPPLEMAAQQPPAVQVARTPAKYSEDQPLNFAECNDNAIFNKGFEPLEGNKYSLLPT
jgi:hypothetical protein